MPMTCTRSSTLRVDTPLMQAAVSAFCAMRRGSRNAGKSLPLRRFGIFSSTAPVRGARKTLDLKRHQALGREPDHLVRQIGVGTLLQQRLQGHHVLGGHRGTPPVGWTPEAQP